MKRGKGPYGPFSGHSCLLQLQWPLITNIMESPPFITVALDSLHVDALLDIDDLSIGIIKAIQLDYSEAHKNLLQAIRKAPQHSGYGFKQTVSILTQTDMICSLCSFKIFFLTLCALIAFLEQLHHVYI